MNVSDPMSEAERHRRRQEREDQRRRVFEAMRDHARRNDYRTSVGKRRRMN